MTNHEIWQAVLAEMEISISKANFITWFKNTSISAIENGKIIISVPNIFTKSWLEKKYNREIMQALENVTNQKTETILYKVEVVKQETPTFNVSLTQNQQPLTTPVSSTTPTNPTSTPSPATTTTQSAPQTTTTQTTANRFGLNPTYLFENFIVGKNNQLAHAAGRAVSTNPGSTYNPLFIYGGVGLGKTHLLHAIGNELIHQGRKVLYVTCEKFTNDYIQAVRSGRGKEFKDFYRNIDVLMVDDIQFMGGKDGTQEEFFHTFNDLHQSNRQIIVSSDRQPKAIQSLEQRLQSRFEWGMIVDVTPPDVETRSAILETKCQERGASLDYEVITYIANAVQSNIRELEGALNRVLAHYELNQTELSLDNVKMILSNIIGSVQQKSLHPKLVIESVARFYDIEVVDLLGKSRKKELVVPRQIAMYLMREEIGTSYPTIGQEFGGRDHTTAIHACNKVDEEARNNQRRKQEIESIRQLLYSN